MNKQENIGEITKNIENIENNINSQKNIKSI